MKNKALMCYLGNYSATYSLKTKGNRLLFLTDVDGANTLTVFNS